VLRITGGGLSHVILRETSGGDCVAAGQGCLYGDHLLICRVGDEEGFSFHRDKARLTGKEAVP
jgi:hypothetical protein